MCFGCIIYHLYDSVEVYKNCQIYLENKQKNECDEELISFYRTKNIPHILSIAEKKCIQIIRPYVLREGNISENDKNFVDMLNINKDMIVSAALYDLICKYNIIDIELIQLIVNENPSKENLKLLNDLKSSILHLTSV